MARELSGEDFDLVHAALVKATDDYGLEDVADVLIALRKARRKMDELAQT